MKEQLNNWIHLYTVEFASTNLIMFQQMSALKSANKELKGMMKTVKINDIDVCILRCGYVLVSLCIYPQSFPNLSWLLIVILLCVNLEPAR